MSINGHSFSYSTTRHSHWGQHGSEFYFDETISKSHTNLVDSSDSLLSQQVNYGLYAFHMILKGINYYCFI